MDDTSRKKKALQRIMEVELVNMETQLKVFGEELNFLENSLERTSKVFSSMNRVYEQLTRILELDKGND
jgi:hypothetical protein